MYTNLRTPPLALAVRRARRYWVPKLELTSRSCGASSPPSWWTRQDHVRPVAGASSPRCARIPRPSDPTSARARGRGCEQDENVIQYKGLIELKEQIRKLILLFTLSKHSRP